MQKQERQYINSNTFYYPKHKLGDGSFGSVFKGMLIKEDCYVAIKIIAVLSQQKRKSFNKQIEALKNVRHHNIVKFYGCFEIKQKNACFIILEFCEGGTLTKEIQNNGKIPELVCLRYLKQIVHAIASVTSQNMIHRDLKPANILLTISKEIKICDFGVARKMIGDDPNVIMGGMTNGAGTPYTMAPQVVSSNTYGAKCDVWSIGVVLVEMLTGKNIFEQCKSIIQLFETQNKLSIQGYHLKGNYNDFFKTILKKILTFDQNIRMTISDLKKLIDNNYDNIKKQLGFEQIPVINQGTISNQIIPQHNARIENVASKFNKIKILQCVKTPNQISKQKQRSCQNSPVSFNNKQQQSPEPVLKLKNNITELEKDLQSKQQSQILFQNFKLYMKYLIDRYDLYITFNKYNMDNKSNSQNKCQRYILTALLLALTIKSIEDIQIILLSNIISLPNKSTLVISNLFHSVKIQLQGQKKQYLTDISERKIQCLSYLKKLYEMKLSNSQYQKNFTKTLAFFKHIVTQLQKVSTQNKLYESKQWYQLWYNKILFTYQWQNGNQKPQQMSSSYLRIYWGLVKLIKLDVSFPIQKYNTDTVLLFYDTFRKETHDYYLQDIKKFKHQIKM